MGAPLSAIGRSVPSRDDERGVVGEPDDHALREHAVDRVDGLRARVLVDDVEDLVDRVADGFLLRPAGQPLGDRIDRA